MKPSRSDAKKDDSYPYTTLRQIADYNPNLLLTKTLTLNNQRIIQIDLLLKPAYEIEQLNLSRNSIKDLRGLEQFPNLRKLDLSHNQIHDIHNIFYLKNLTKLENLNLAANGITAQANYKETVLCMIPSLRYLDNREIKQADIDAIDPNLRKQYALLEILLQNYCELIKMQSALKKLDIHKELFQKDKRFLINYVPFNVKKFRSMYTYTERLDEKIKNDFRIDLLKDIKIIEDNLLRRNDLDTAAQELITRQQSKINELCKAIDKKAKILETVQSQNASKFVKYKRDRDSVIVSPPRAQSSSRFDQSKGSRSVQGNTSFAERGSLYRSGKKDSELHESLNTSFKSATGGKSSKSVPTTRRIHRSDAETLIHGSKKKSESPRRSQSPKEPSPRQTPSRPMAVRSISPQQYRPSEKRRTEKLSEREDLTATTNETELRKRLSPVQPSQSPAPGSAQLRSQDQSPVREIRESTTSLKMSPGKHPTSPKAQTISEKDKQINNLSRNLKKKIEDVLRVEDLYKQTAEKMRKLQEQSDLNSKISKEEFLLLQKELNRTTDTKEVLENEIIEMQIHLDELKSKANELELENRALQEDSMRARIYARELAILETIEGKLEIAERFYGQKITYLAFKFLRLAVLKSRRVERFQKNAELRRNRILVDGCFRTLQRKMILSKIVRVKHLERTKNLCGDVLYTWKLNAVFSKRYRFMQQEQKDSLLVRAFKSWKSYMVQRDNKKRNYATIADYRAGVLTKAGFVAFKKNFKLYNHPAIELKKKEREAASYHRQHQKRYFLAVWRHCVYHVLTPKRLKLEQAASLYIKSLLNYGLTLFKENVLFYKRAHNKAEYLYKQKQRRLVAEHFDAWRYDYHEQVIFKEKLNVLQNTYILNRRWQLWRGVFRESQYIHTISRSAEAHHEKSTLRKVFNALFKNLMTLKKRRALLNSYETYRSSSEKKQAFIAWRYALSRRREDKRKAEDSRLRLLAKMFESWKEANTLIRLKKGKIRRAGNQRFKNAIKLASNIFQSWKQNTVYKKRLATIEETIANRQNLSTYRFFFGILAGETTQGLRRKIGQLTYERDVAINKSQENLEYGNKVDEERLNLMDKLEVLSKTIDGLNEENAQQTETIESLNSQLSEKKITEERVASELRMKDDAIKKLGMHLEEARRMVENRNQELENLMHEHRGQRQDLQAQIDNLRNETDSKQRLTHEMENALLRRTEEHNHYVKTTELQLGQASAENTDLREELEKKDSELREVIHALDEYIAKNEDLKGQLRSSLDSMVEASSRYESKFSELHLRNTELEGDNEELSRQNKQYQGELVELRSLLRKYEYEVEMLNVAQHNETEEFIRNLHKNKERVDSVKREQHKLNGEQRSYKLESSQSATRLERPRANLNKYELERERKSETFDGPIHELQTYLASPGNYQDGRRSHRISKSPPVRSPPVRSPEPLHSNREEPYYHSQREKRSPPKENFYLEKGRGSRTNTAASDKDTSYLKSNASVENIQREVEKFKSFKTQIKDNMAQRNRESKHKIFS